MPHKHKLDSLSPATDIKHRKITKETTPQNDQKLGANNLASVLADYKNAYPSGISELLSTFPGREVWRLFIDGDHQKLSQTWENYETREPGYLYAMSTAFVYMMDHVRAKSPLNLAFIKKLHQLALSDVSNTLYPDNPKNNKYEFDSNGAGVTFSFINSNTRGREEVLDRIKNGNPLITLQIDYGNAIDVNNIETSYESALLLLKPTSYLPHIRKSCEIMDSKIANQYFEKLLDAYTLAMKLATTEKEKLQNIVKLVTEFEQSHPYEDGNGRTFCTLLLNYLLITNNFPLVVLNEPNRFDGFDKDRLLQDVVDGMRNTLTLLKTKQLFGISTNDILDKNPNDAVFNQSYKILKKHFDLPKLALFTEAKKPMTRSNLKWASSAFLRTKNTMDKPPLHH